MRAFSAEFFARSPVLIFPLIALGIFFVVFVAIALRVMLTQREEADAAARLPLDSQPRVHRTPRDSKDGDRHG